MLHSTASLCAVAPRPVLNCLLLLGHTREARCLTHGPPLLGTQQQPPPPPPQPPQQSCADSPAACAHATRISLPGPAGVLLLVLLLPPLCRAQQHDA
jgi:hypothetical protein